MPLFTNSSAAKGSTRRPRGESESRRPTSHRVESERRRAAREATSSSSRGSDRRSPPSTKTNSAAASIYSQPSITHDQALQDTASDSESSPLSPRSPEMRLATTASNASYQYQLETPSSLLQYLDTEDEDATPQPKKEQPLMPPTLRRQPAMTTSPTPSKQELQSRPLTPESTGAKDDNETVTGSPQHMSMSMPQLRRDRSQDEPPPPSPLVHRAFTPPAPVHQSPLPQIAQPMPLYPQYPMQDPRAYYAPPMPSQQMQPQQMQGQQIQGQAMQGQPMQGQPMPHMQQQGPPQAPIPPQYMYEPRYDEQRYDLASRQQLGMGPYYNQSPDPYHQSPYQHHRLSMASAGADSQYTQDSGSGDRATVASHGHTATGRTSPQDETSDLLSRISTALPDLALLLSRCEEVTGHHTHHKEQKLLTSSAGEDGHVEALLKQKESRIEDLEKELAAKTQSHTAEKNKMRFEIGNLQEQFQDLQDDLVSFKRSSISKASTDSAASSLEDTIALRRELDSSKRRTRELDEAKVVTDRQLASLESQLRVLTNELEAKKSSESILQTKLRDMSEIHARERDTLVAAAAATKDGNINGLRELNEALMREKRELETALRAKDVRLEESRKIWAKDLETARAASAREVDELRKQLAASKSEKDECVKSFDAERVQLKSDLQTLRAESEKESRSLQRKHEKALAEVERTLELKFDEQCKDLEAERDRARKDWKRVKRDWHADRERAYEERGKVRAAAAKMAAEHAGLMKMLEGYAEPTERDREREKREAEREARERERSERGERSERERERGS